VGSLPQQLLALHLSDNQTSQGTEKEWGNLEQSWIQNFSNNPVL
jgi:hypothetical protein